MPESAKSWENHEILREFLWFLLQYIDESSFRSMAGVREAAMDENPNRLRDRLWQLQTNVVARFLAVIDGAGRPYDWPSIYLVNGDTGESMSDDFPWAFSEVESDFELSDSPIEPEWPARRAQVRSGE